MGGALRGSSCARHVHAPAAWPSPPANPNPNPNPNLQLGLRFQLVRAGRSLGGACLRLLQLGLQRLQLGLLRLLRLHPPLPLGAQRIVAVVTPRLLAQAAHSLLLTVRTLSTNIVLASPVALALAARPVAATPVARPNPSPHLVEGIVIVHLVRVGVGVRVRVGVGIRVRVRVRPSSPK